MGNSKHSFLKQWFTFQYHSDKSIELLYSCTNNHYIHEWFEARGYTSFVNIMSTEDLDLFITALNESGNMVRDDSFYEYFPESENYTLWNMDKSEYWYNG